jgi:phosphomannomutase
MNEKSSDTGYKTLVLFDVDGTLTPPRGQITPSMSHFLEDLQSSTLTIGIVGGSDLPKQKEQLGENVLNLYPWNFSQNGLVAYKNGELLAAQSLSLHLGEDNIQRIINWTLKYLSSVEIPIKRGTFIEYRTGMLNISPIGRNCSREERDDFERYDYIHKIREKMVNMMKCEFKDLDLTFSIGGQISFDVFPKGWDKTYCLRFVEHQGFDEIHFFGDKTAVGGNDYEIFMDERTIGHTVVGWEDTMRQCRELFLK